MPAVVLVPAVPALVPVPAVPDVPVPPEPDSPLIILSTTSAAVVAPALTEALICAISASYSAWLI